MDIDRTVSVLLPVCNEGEVIEKVVNDWLIQIKTLPAGSNILIEDANSTDGTREILQRAEFQNPQYIKVFYRDDRDGFRNALLRLFDHSNADYIFVADTDGQYFVTDFPYFLKRAALGNDFVKGVKINRRDGFFRRFFSYLMNRFVVVFIGLPAIDYNSSHYLIRKDFLNSIRGEGFVFKYSLNVEVTLKALLANADYSIIYVKHQSRSQGVSRGNPPLKFMAFGITTIREIWNYKSNF
jgi:glycosyltransferase involved in cell wall biosynthesis